MFHQLFCVIRFHYWNDNVQTKSFHNILVLQYILLQIVLGNVLFLIGLLRSAFETFFILKSSFLDLIKAKLSFHVPSWNRNCLRFRSGLEMSEKSNYLLSLSFLPQHNQSHSSLLRASKGSHNIPHHGRGPFNSCIYHWCVSYFSVVLKAR